MSQIPSRYKCLPIELWQEDDPFCERGDEDATFISRCFGDFGFSELKIPIIGDAFCEETVCCGAESGSEIGAFHNVFHAQRHRRLATQVSEFTPVDMTSRISFVDEAVPKKAR